MRREDKERLFLFLCFCFSFLLFLFDLLFCRFFLFSLGFGRHALFFGGGEGSRGGEGCKMGASLERTMLELFPFF